MSGELPLSIRDVSPGLGAVRLTGEHPGTGFPSGYHTGGAWELDGEVWKPLDGRPYANCPNHYPTQEDECLELMAGLPLFPRNWRVETRNGRRFLVRKKALLIPDDVGWKYLTRERLLEVEAALRDLWYRHWEVGDALALAIDPDSYELFLYDLSTAHPQKGKCAFAADETWRVLDLFEQAGHKWLRRWREKARHQLAGLLLDVPRGYRHVYGSFNRPVSTLWATIPDAELRHSDSPSWPDAEPHTWIFTPLPLVEEVQRYELTWGWSPIHRSDDE